MSERQHQPYHQRRVDQQILDALLRIEELLRPDRINSDKVAELIADSADEITKAGPATEPIRGQRGKRR